MNGYFMSSFSLFPSFLSCYFSTAFPLLFSFLFAAFVRRVLILGLYRRHMEKKGQRERGFAGVDVGFESVGMGERQEVGVVEDEGLDEKYLGRDGGEVKDEFEKEVKVLERSVRSMQL